MMHGREAAGSAIGAPRTLVATDAAASTFSVRRCARCCGRARSIGPALGRPKLARCEPCLSMSGACISPRMSWHRQRSRRRVDAGLIRGISHQHDMYRVIVTLAQDGFPGGIQCASPRRVRCASVWAATHAVHRVHTGVCMCCHGLLTDGLRSCMGAGQQQPSAPGLQCVRMQFVPCSASGADATMHVMRA